MHPSIIAEFQDFDTPLEVLRKVKQEIKAALDEAQSTPIDSEDYDRNEDGDLTFDGYTLTELESTYDTLKRIYRQRIRQAAGR